MYVGRTVRGTNSLWDEQSVGRTVRGTNSPRQIVRRRNRISSSTHTHIRLHTNSVFSAVPLIYLAIESEMVLKRTLMCRLLPSTIMQCIWYYIHCIENACAA